MRGRGQDLALSEHPFIGYALQQMTLNTDTIKEYAYTLGFDLVRITTAEAFPEAEHTINERIARGLMDGLPWFTTERATVSCHPDALLPEARSIISLAMSYLTQTPNDTTMSTAGTPRGRISRYAWGDDYHDIIKPKLQQFAQWLRDYARQMDSEIGSDDVETRLFVDTGRMVDRAVAQRSGLGWYGKNTNILTKGWGSWVFLAEIVTNLPLEPDEALKTHCGNCEICLHACPTGALPNPYELDTPRCISFLTIELRGSIPLELRPLMGNLIFGCDICQEVCPVNKMAERRIAQNMPNRQDQTNQTTHFVPTNSIQRREKAPPVPTPSIVQPKREFFPRSSVGTAPELIPLLALTEEEFRTRFRHSPIKRAKRRGLLRNVCVALGNIGDPQAVPALIGALHDYEALIRGHAAWALGRIRSEEAMNALYWALQTEQDGEVQQEILCAIEAH
jgi:epoxyqueuosine reductase